MRLEVEPSDLTSFSHLVSRAKDDITDGLRYIEKHTSIEAWHEGIFKTLLSPHNAVVDDVTSALTRLATVLNACSNELSRTGTYYRTTDIDVARRVDATYPTEKR
ncbi:hypothetical protein ACWGJ2_08415 [Streptomyces sp. NPDC054796]